MSRLARVRRTATAVGVLRRAGALPGPRELPAVAGLRRTLGDAAGPRVLATRFGTRTALVDPLGPVSYVRLADDADRFAHAINRLLPDLGRRTVGVMCRNSRYVPLALFGAMATGARVVFLNTDLGSKQLGAVCEREGIDLLVHDAEFGAVVDGAGVQAHRLVALPEADGSGDRRTLGGELAASPAGPPPAPTRAFTLVILTSGSSGTPKGAPRGEGSTNQLLLMAGFLQKIPIRSSDTVLIAPPAFHGWGLIALTSSLAVGATVVFPGRFDAAKIVDSVVAHRATALVVVPTMLHRLLRLAPDELDRIPRGQLRVLGSGGARLDPALVAGATRRFGQVLHNLYGATEVSFITIATPDDLRDDPSSAGSAPVGVEVAIIRDGRRLGAGKVGEIYVRTSSQAGKYSDGTGKETFQGMVRTGDLGRLDRRGRLKVEGRVDGMIVSGGENVHPEEVELVLRRHPSIGDAAVTGFDDPEFGQRLAAVLVPANPTSAPDPDELNAFVAAELSRSRVPARYVVVDDLPRTATGKVTRATFDTLLGEERRTPDRPEAPAAAG